MATENRFFNSYNDVGIVAHLLCFSLRRTGCRKSLSFRYKNLVHSIIL